SDLLQRYVALRAITHVGAAGSREISKAAPCRRDNRRDRPRERDEARREHTTRADVADVRAPQLSWIHFREQERSAGCWIDRKIRVDRRERFRDELTEDRQQGQQPEPCEHT